MRNHNGTLICVPPFFHLTALITYTGIGILGASVVLFMYIPDSGFDWPVVIGAGVSSHLANWQYGIQNMRADK